MSRGHCALFARTSGNDGDASGISCFIVPTDIAGRERLKNTCGPSTCRPIIREVELEGRVRA
jgi:alkylation response protein AidB-like acyl-CoA dehydrogenase